MPRDLITFAEFAAKVADDEEDFYTRADLARFDYDPPKERCALVTWSSSGSCWKLIEGGDASRFEKLHDVGVMMFGLPPWRRSCVLRCVGKLGFVEQCIAELAPPGPDFVYAFAYEEPKLSEVPVRPVGRVVRGSARLRDRLSTERRLLRVMANGQLDMFSEKGRR